MDDITARVRADAAFQDRYELGEKLGEGGMGAVHRGVQKNLKRPVAIKLMAPELAREPGYVERFLAEARLAASLSHPSVVLVFDFGMAGEVPYLVTEYVPGRTLAELLKEKGTLPVADTVAIARGMLDGLGAIHALGIVHRDIKPANVLVTPGPPPGAKLLDFGIAKQTGAPPGGETPRTATGLVMGTPEYMAPEQAAADALSPATDLYAFTLVLFRMIVGRHAFQASTTLEMLRMQVHADAEIPATLAAPVRELLRRGLAKQPGDRPQSAAEMRALLDLAAPHLEPPSGTRVAMPAVPEPPASSLAPKDIVTVPSLPAGAAPRVPKRAGALVLAAAALLAGLVAFALHARGPQLEPVAPFAEDVRPDLHMQIKDLIYDEDRAASYKDAHSLPVKNGVELSPGQFQFELALSQWQTMYWNHSDGFEDLGDDRLRVKGLHTPQWITAGKFALKDQGMLEVGWSDAHPAGAVELQLASAPLAESQMAVLYRLRVDLAHPAFEVMVSDPTQSARGTSEYGEPWRVFKFMDTCWLRIHREEYRPFGTKGAATLAVRGDGLTVKLGQDEPRVITLPERFRVRPGYVYSYLHLYPGTDLVVDRVRLTGDVYRAVAR